MYLSLALTLGSVLAVTLPVMASDRVVMEQGLGAVGDRSLKVQPADMLNLRRVFNTKNLMLTVIL